MLLTRTEVKIFAIMRTQAALQKKERASEKQTEGKRNDLLKIVLPGGFIWREGGSSVGLFTIFIFNF